MYCIENEKYSIDYRFIVYDYSGLDWPDYVLMEAKETVQK